MDRESRGCRACLAVIPADAEVCPDCGTQASPAREAPAPDPFLSPAGEPDLWGAPPSASAEPQPAKPAPFAAEAPRRAVWILLLLLVVTYVQVAGDRWSHPQGALPQRVLRAGALQAGPAADLPRGAWRLVFANFVHQNSLVLLVTCFLVWRLGGLVERRLGGGTLAFVFVAGGALLNTLRLELESAQAVLYLAGGWPAAVLLGGVALSVALRTQRELLSVCAALAIDLTILATAAAGFGLDLLPSLEVAGVGLVLGAILGAFVPLRAQQPGVAAVSGCLLGALTVALVGGAATLRVADREWGASRRFTHERGAPLDEELVEVDAAAGLGLVFDLPASWTLSEPPGMATCPKCKTEVGPAELDQRHLTCPKCQASVSVDPVRQARYVESGLLNWSRRHIDVWSWPRGQFDAPDTLAGRRLADVAQGDIPFLDPVLVYDRPFRGAMGLGHQVVLRVHLKGRGQDEFVFRLYVFVGEQRTAYVTTVAPVRLDPVEQDIDQALFDAIARSVHEPE